MRLARTLGCTVAAAATLFAVGCGTAKDTASRPDNAGSGAQLTAANFVTSVTDATNRMHSVHITATFAGQGHQVTLTGDESFGDRTLRGLAVQMSMSMAGMGQLECRLVDGVLYVNAGSLGMPGPKPWLKVDLTDASGPFASMFGNLGQRLGPDQLMQNVKALGHLHRVGTETVDGVATTHFAGTIEVAKVAKMLGLPQSELHNAQLPKSFPYDMWVDARSLPVKAAMSAAGFSMEMHFSKWNQPVSVQAPPASEVRQLPSGLGAGLTS